MRVNRSKTAWGSIGNKPMVLNINENLEYSYLAWHFTVFTQTTDNINNKSNIKHYCFVAKYHYYARKIEGACCWFAEEKENLVQTSSSLNRTGINFKVHDDLNTPAELNVFKGMCDDNYVYIFNSKSFCYISLRAINNVHSLILSLVITFIYFSNTRFMDPEVIGNCNQ